MKTESRLAGEFEELYSIPDSPRRDSLNTTILLQLRDALDSWDSFFYNWDKLKYTGIFRSQDNKVRVYTWFLEHDNGEYSYYGFIQHLNGRKKKNAPWNSLNWRIIMPK